MSTLRTLTNKCTHSDHQLQQLHHFAALCDYLQIIGQTNYLSYVHKQCAQKNKDEIYLGIARAQHRPQRSAPTRNSINTSFLPYIEMLQGKDGRDGRDGVLGPHGPQGQRGEQGAAGPPGPRNGGVVYIRWGKSSSPNVTGTTVVYAGRAGGSYF